MRDFGDKVSEIALTIISWHVDGLHGGDGTLLGGGNPLLHGTHIGGQGWLVSDSGRDTTQQSRHLGTGLGESENVVDEEQHILTLIVTEVLGNGETGQSDTGTGTWWLVHLTEHESDLGFTLKVDDTSLPHLRSKRSDTRIGQHREWKEGDARKNQKPTSWYKSLPSRVRSPTPVKTE